MKEDLNLHSNELNYIRAVFCASYYTSMIPACYWLTRTRINIALPTLGIGTKPVTGLFTFGCAWAQNLSTIYAMRFWSRSTNLAPSLASSMSSGHRTSPARWRVGLRFSLSPLGTMFAGYMQAAAYMGFNGRHGLSGWRYLTLIIYGRVLVTDPLGDGRSSFSLLSTIPICIV